MPLEVTDMDTGMTLKKQLWVQVMIQTYAPKMKFLVNFLEILLIHVGGMD